MRHFFFLIFAVVIAGCTPQHKPVDTSQNINAGVNIVPQAILASEKMSPDTTQPSDNSRPDLVQVLSESQQKHEKILRALRVDGLIPDLRAVGPYTLLAPTDEAFDKLPPGTLDRLLQPANRDRLGALLRYHLLSGRIAMKDLLDTNGMVSTLAGNQVIIKGTDNKVMVNDVNIIRAENTPSNGVIYWIDGVLLPPT